MFPCSLGYLQPRDTVVSKLRVCVHIASWYLRLLNTEDCKNTVKLRGSFGAELMMVCNGIAGAVVLWDCCRLLGW